MPVTATTGRASSSNDFTLAALSDLYRIFEAAVRDTKKTVAQAKQSRTVVSHMELKRSLQMATRKLYFFLSYVASNTDDVASLAMPVKLELGNTFDINHTHGVHHTDVLACWFFFWIREYTIQSSRT